MKILPLVSCFAALLCRRDSFSKFRMHALASEVIPLSLSVERRIFLIFPRWVAARDIAPGMYFIPFPVYSIGYILLNLHTVTYVAHNNTKVYMQMVRFMNSPMRMSLVFRCGSAITAERISVSTFEGILEQEWMGWLWRFSRSMACSPLTMPVSHLLLSASSTGHMYTNSTGHSPNSSFDGVNFSLGCCIQDRTSLVARTYVQLGAGQLFHSSTRYYSVPKSLLIAIHCHGPSLGVACFTLAELYISKEEVRVVTVVLWQSGYICTVSKAFCVRWLQN